MNKTKEKKQPFPIYPIDAWSVEKYGVKLLVNTVFPCTFTLSFPSGCSLDVEDDEQGHFVGIGIYDPNCNTCYYWSDWEIAKQLQIPKFIGHNGLSDVRKLQTWDYPIDDSWLLWDTQLMSHILDSSRRKYGLKHLAKEDLGIEYPSYDDIVGKRTEKQTKPRITLDKQPLELVANYNAMDCYTTYKLYEKQKQQDQVGEYKYGYGWDYFQAIEKPAAIVFEAMTEKGISIDLAYLTKLKQTLEAQKDPLSRQIKNELGDINLNSPKQLLEALNGKGIFPVLKGKPSTDKRALESLRSNAIVSSLLKFSELETLLTSFVSPYIERGETVGQTDGVFTVHPQFHQTGTRTGRPSCSNPNLLQIPKRSDNGKLVRKMFVARPGHMFGRCDYKEGEPRMLAHLSQDKDMCALFNEGRGFHDYFAEHLNISRDKAKVFDLETYYRVTKYGVARHLNCGLQEAQRRIDEAWNLFPGLYDWEQRVIYDAKKNGFITTLKGRRIRIDELDSPNSWKREAAERRCMNNLAQASLQECTKAAMIGIHKAGINILLQVYDDLLIESPEDAISADIEIMIDIMESITTLSIPMKVDSGIGYDWSEC